MESTILFFIKYLKGDFFDIKGFKTYYVLITIAFLYVFNIAIRQLGNAISRRRELETKKYSLDDDNKVDNTEDTYLGLKRKK